MTHRLTCHNNQTRKSYDITDLAGSVQHVTSLSSQPGKLTFTLRSQPEKSIGGYESSEPLLANGSMITFEKDGKGVFLGYIFSMTADASGTCKVTSYDQLRYLKNEDTEPITPMTASDAFEKICNKHGILRTIKTPSRSLTPAHYHDKKSLYSMMEYHIMWANTQERKQFFVKDDFGVLTFTELAAHKTNIVIGDGSLLSAYQYEISIDKDTYNVVKLYRENGSTGRVDAWVEMDSANQARWGKLQLLERVNDDMNEAQIKELANRLLTLKNRQTRTMRLSVIAAGSEIGLPKDLTLADASLLVAGSGFRLRLEKLGIEEDIWIEEAAHNYTRDVHTISMEVFMP